MSAKKEEPTPKEGEESDAPEDDRPMTFWEHLEELRSRVVKAVLALCVGTGITWYFKERVLAFLYEPMKEAWIERGLPNAPSLNFKSPADPFIAYFNLSLIGGIVLAAPFIFYQLWSFIAPGLYAKEKRMVIPFVFFSSVLFIGGGYFGYRAAFPITFGYFLSLAGDVEGTVQVTPTLMMDDYISFVMKMLLGFGAIFEIPILATFLARVGLLTHTKMIRWMRYYIFIAFFVAAVLTPPEWTSQLVMAVPACLLYFASIGLVYVFQRKEALAADVERMKEKKAEEEAKARAEKARAR